jgi:glutamate-1-semialdehyde 2,1-aminomutase
MPGGVSSPVRAFEPYPFFTKYAKGSKLIDVDGNEYIDYCLAYGPLILGHCNREVITAVKKQLDRGTMYGTPTEQEIELAEVICDNIPSIEQVRFVNTGTEATMSAIRASRAYTQKKKIIKFEGCYHGAHDYVLVKAGSGATTFGTPDSLGIPEETTRNTIIVPYNDTEALKKVVSDDDDIAAVIIEPVMGNIGVVLPKEGFLLKVRKLTEQHGILLIFDEIITGFRLAFGGAQQYYNIIPDITTLGKILGGGFPIAAYGGKKDIMEMIAPVGKVYQAGTFSGNPVSVKAGLATLQFIKKMGTVFYENLENKRKSICEAINDFMQDSHLNLQINGVASMFQIFFSPEPVYDYTSAKKSDIHDFKVFHSELLKRGVFIPPSQFETCFISIAHQDDDLQKTIDFMREALAKVKS